jgi:hypothetical protein
MMTSAPGKPAAIRLPSSCSADVMSLLAGSEKPNTCAGYCSQIEMTGTPDAIEETSTPGDG